MIKGLLGGMMLILAAAAGPGSAVPPSPFAKVAEQDSEQVLTKAAQAFVAMEGKHWEIPGDFCAATDFYDGEKIDFGTPQPDGWISTTTADPDAIRLLDGPKLDKLPSAAHAAFRTERSDCRHAIHFGHPIFYEVRSRRGNYVEALIFLSDLCPLCGQGYEMAFRKDGNQWTIEPPGIRGTWMS